MATEDEINQLRRLIDDVEAPQTYTDEELTLLLDAAGDMDEAAASVWEQKAASYSTMVNISESGSSRSMGDLYKNAIAQARYFRDKDKDEESLITSRSRMRSIERQ